MPRFAVFSLLLIASPAIADDRKIDFVQDVRPLFVKSCVSCHGPDKQRGGLRLDRKPDALKGGDSGAAILPGKGADSLLVKLVSGVDADRMMPPKGDRLTAEQVATLRTWIDQGANWPDDGNTAANPADWWSLKPLPKPAVPTLHVDDAKKARNAVDTFVLAKLREKGLAMSPEADKRTLIRRLSFDLTGLPPTLEEIEAFEKDASPTAYESLVTRLLDSPAYGERWARHWLDVVHYGDTHGYDKDQPRPHAYPYRDYVIRSLNADKPYSRFLQEQIAGDVLFPGTTDGVTGLGFIAAGPWDLIGHAEVPETKIDGKIARHLDRDDMIANTIGTFVSLTVHCAQCHNHKFDPIPQEDYYRLQAVFAALDRADRPYYADAASAKRAAELMPVRDTLRAKQRGLNAKLKSFGGKELVALDAKIAVASRPLAGTAEHGYHSGIEKKPDATKWVRVDLGKSVALTKVVLWGCLDNFNNIGAGFGFPVRFKVEACDDPTFKTGVVTVADRTAEDFANPGVSGVSLATEKVTARYLRVTATKLAPRLNDFIFALAELEAFDTDGKNVAAKTAVTALDTIEAGTTWAKTNLTNGYAPGMTAASNLADLKSQRAALVAKVADATLTMDLADTSAELQKIENELIKVPPTGVVYAGTIHSGVGTFAGTGPIGKPRPIHLLRRGDVTKPAQEVEPAALSGVPGLPANFDLPADAPEGERRAALAKWLTDSRNPLTWRSIANRVWMYHFGRGIVGTPNDFGRMGQLPTHPELLDYLAAEFRDNGQSLKKLHRLIVTSAAYRQSSAGNDAFDKLDANNAYLWRQNRRKLEAEAVRDAVLLVAGKLDRTPFGPAFQDFKIEHPAHSPHYEYHLADPNDPKTHRRSVYRFLVRSKQQPFMTVLDCADPSMQVDKRNETMSPLQALALLNNKLMLVMAKHLADRVEKSGDASGQVTAAFRLALGRSPTATERDALAGHVKTHGLPSACRVILNLNEFVFVD